MEAKDKPKRNRVTLSIEQKIEIIEKLDRGISNIAIASEYILTVTVVHILTLFVSHTVYSQIQ